MTWQNQLEIVALRNPIHTLFVRVAVTSHLGCIVRDAGTYAVCNSGTTWWNIFCQ